MLPLFAVLTLQWHHERPEWLFCLLVVVAFLVVAVGGQIAIRPVVRRWLGGSDYNDIFGHYLDAWENFGEVENKASQEAAAIASR